MIGDEMPGNSLKPRRFVFWLLPDFSMMPLTSAVEPLRVANRMTGAPLFDWRLASLDGNPVSASSGVSIRCDGAIGDMEDYDTLVVCGGIDAGRHCSAAALAEMRRIARRGLILGSVCTGSMLLAHAGLLDGYRCTIHWEDAESFAENFPALDVTANLYEIDGRRFTCSGGTAPLDLMIHFISDAGGRELAARVADQMLHHSARQAGDPQRLALSERTGVRHAKLLDAVALMEENLENPLTINYIANKIELSIRQLERLFKIFLHASPARYYLQLRMQRAQQLVMRTSMPMLEIAMATGFVSGGHFTKSYRNSFGHAPSIDRAASRL